MAPKGSYGKSGKLTPRLVAWRLGVTPATVLKLREQRILPAENIDGVWLFDPEPVDAYARRIAPKADRKRKNQQATLSLRAFKLFDEGCTNMREAVRKLRTTPDQVARMYALWKEQDIEKHVHIRASNRKSAVKSRGRSKLVQIADLLQMKAVQEERKPKPRTGIDQDLDDLFKNLEGVPTYGPKKKPS